jgi:hypothetical protein
MGVLDESLWVDDNEAVSAVASADGTYFVRVFGVGARNVYQLGVNLTP